MSIRIRTTPASDAWRALLHTHALVNGRLEADLEEAFDMTLDWYEVLIMLASSPTGRLRMSEVADGRILSRSAATRLIDRMEAHGLVERAQCDQDRRGTEVALTDAGRRRFVEAGRLHLKGIEEYFGGELSPTELDVLTKALTRVSAANG